jgi:hypothetical protein
MVVAIWTEADSERAVQIWSEYEQNHDVSQMKGQTAGIDPGTSHIWFGDSIEDVVAQRDGAGSDALLYFVRIGYKTYYRKVGKRWSMES